MSRFLSLVYALTATVACSSAVGRSSAQTTARTNNEQDGVVLAKLTPPLYPPLAKQARIMGDVDLILAVRPDGSIESAVAVSGHPLLKQAALVSAQQSEFACRSCNEAVTSQRIIYTFQLGPAEYCSETPATPKVNEREESYPRVIQSTNHVTLIDQSVGTCDTEIFSAKKVRSAKCLYLWRCGHSGVIPHQDSLP
jgi:hypothetical protein